jgi:uncharacterized protein (TIGR02118 family)
METQHEEANVIKIMLLLKKREDLSSESFRRHWRETHAPLLAQLPGLERLVFNYTLPGPDGTPPEYDGISENWFTSVEAMQGAFASPAGQAVAADSPNFLDLGALRMLVVDEDPIELTA